MVPERVLVLGGGATPSASVAAWVDGTCGRIIAADGGLDHARALGLVPDLVVGDLDSVSADGLAWAGARGVPIERHPADKDATDLELAMERAHGQGLDIVVIGVGGGRLDHLLANLLLLASPRWVGATVTALLDTAVVSVVRGQRTIGGTPGSILSLLAVHGPADAVTLTGVRWPLHMARLEPGTSWGVSNEFVDHQADVVVGSGVVVAIQPDALAE